MKECDNLVVGAGISGSVLARLLAENGENVTIIDSKNHIAGNIYDYFDKNGICIHKYGSHIFHTNNEKVWQFVNRFSEFNTYMHRVIALIDGIETTIPFNLNTIHDVFPKSLAERLEHKLISTFAYNTKVPILEFMKVKDEDLNFLAKYIYEKVFLHYTAKQWGKRPEDIDNYVTSRVPVYISKDSRYFQDKYQGIPINGYTEMVKNILNHKNINLKLNTNFSHNIRYKRLFYTGSIDEFFNYKYGMLPYRSLDFKLETHNTEFYQKNAVVNYPCNYNFTRIHEYKYYLKNKSQKTVIAKEYPKKYEPNINERYYPIVSDENQELYNKYKKEIPDNVYFLGRLGDYKYYDMDKAIERAIKLYEEIQNTCLK